MISNTAKFILKYFKNGQQLYLMLTFTRKDL